MTLRTHVGGTLFAEHVDGRPPRVLALHGWGRDRTDLLAALEGREVVSVDLPGFGSSPEPPEVWGAAAYAGVVARLVEELGGEPVIVVGHSFGGRVAVHLAADRPELVSGLVLTGAPLLRRESASRPPLGYRVARAANRLGVLPDSKMDQIRRRRGSADYNAASGRMRGVLVKLVNEDYRPQLQGISCPVALCWGSDDRAAPAAIAHEAAAIIPEVALLEVVDGVGHDVHRQAPERLASAVDTLVDALR